MQEMAALTQFMGNDLVKRQAFADEQYPAQIALATRIVLEARNQRQ
jgi:hypothetical protein